MFNKISDFLNRTWQVSQHVAVVQERNVGQIPMFPVALGMTHIAPKGITFLFPIEPSSTDPIAPQPFNIPIVSRHRLGHAITKLQQTEVCSAL